MKNDRTTTIFYLGLKHVHKHGSAKFQPNPLFSSQQMGTEHAGGKKVGKPIGDPVGTGCPEYCKQCKVMPYRVQLPGSDQISRNFLL